MPKPDYDTTVARIAGNIAAGMVGDANASDISAAHVRSLTHVSVWLARAIVAEVKRTTPEIPATPPGCWPNRHAEIAPNVKENGTPSPSGAHG